MDKKEYALKMHEEWQGKIEVISRAPITTREELATAYTPGVAEPCLEISKDVDLSYKYTRRGNLVAVITDGTAVLGLGDIGPEAGMPVMEGKCALFKTFGDVDAFPLLSLIHISRILDENKKMTGNALRVIAVAYADSEKLSEEDLIFTGLLGIEDPPRREAKQAVETCKKAGIIPVMITGDHTGTAVSIARRVGILENEKVMSGQEIDECSDEELAAKIHEYRVFSRVTPAHKVRIVKAWQAGGHTVAMTGDGVNDAPALSAADIGCSMGKSLSLIHI